MIRTWAITRQLWHLRETAVLCKQIRQNRYSACSIFSRHSSGSSLSLPSAATLLQDDDKATVVLLGTVHFSKQSVEDVSQIVKVLNPNGILVELCRQRVSLLELDEKKFLEDAKAFDSKKMKQAMKGQNVVSGMLHAMLLKTYADIAKELGVAPGGEFRRAYHEMKKIPGCKLFLGDRPIQVTIARAFQSLSIYELGQVMFHLSAAEGITVDMVTVPAGDYQLGTDDIMIETDSEGPLRTVKLETFLIDRFEVSNRDFMKFVSSTNYKTEAETFGDSFVFTLFLNATYREELKDFRVVQAPWWYKVDGANWRHPYGRDSNISGI
ncbi:hypothetical protein MSG28_007613 [Choristoneura fumiferana]|uniref:Uncharacterized protein n=1 Tax=Choristoneura fumiferana TaxID=7141 RepID=A0ACC0JY87_CHOFU|nr:hypothetical protein MSG28_007613 [Choristoneura fumiferana]